MTNSPRLCVKASSPLEKGFQSEKTICLCQFPTGASGTVVDMTAGPDLQGRLMGMGLFVGTHFQLLQGGCTSTKPLILAVGETRIALGPEIARTIVVES